MKARGERGSVRFAVLAAVGIVGFVGTGAFGCAASGGATDTTASSGGGVGASGGTGGATSGGNDAGGVGGDVGSGGIDDCPGPAGVTLAMDELFLGTTDFNGAPQTDAWATYGFNLDETTTTSNLSGHCIPYQGSSATLMADGAQGIDNSFGKNVLPILLPLVPDIQDQANAALQSGQFSLLFHFDGLADEANVDPLKTLLYSGAPLSAPPQWDGKDCWPVADTSLSDPNDVTSAKIAFFDSVLSGNSWSSNGRVTLVLPISILNVQALLTIYQARMSTVLSSTHQGAALGRIGGVLDTEEFIDVVRNAAATISAPFCGVAFDPTADSIRRASDIMKDGTQDPNSTCDGISIGLGFSLLYARLGPVQMAPPPVMKLCD